MTRTAVVGVERRGRRKRKRGARCIAMGGCRVEAVRGGYGDGGGARDLSISMDGWMDGFQRVMAIVCIYL